MRLYISFLLLIFLSACTEKEQKISAQTIIDKSIEAAGVGKLNRSRLSFDFRDFHYLAERNQGEFALERIQKKEDYLIRDVLSNKGFERFIEDRAVAVSDSLATKYSESVNSVHYFSVLPYGLNDTAVRKKRLKDVKIKGKEYFKIEITFNQEGGGVDFEDVFVYWIHKESYHIDYLAYLFHVNGGGVRFREATNSREINGVRFSDYNNYKPEQVIDVRRTDSAFQNQQLIKVSEINLENIQVELLK